MTDTELTTAGRAHFNYLKHGGTRLDPYNRPFTFDDLLLIARTFDKTGRRYHISANNSMRLIRYVMHLLVEIRLLRAQVAELERGRAGDEKGEGMVDKGNLID